MRQATLLDLASSDSDDTRVSAIRITNKMPTAKNVENRVTKTESKASTRRGGAKKAAAIEKELERAALAEKPTNQPAKSTRGRKAKKIDRDEEVQEDAEDVLATPPGSDEPMRKKGGRGRPRKEAVVPDSTQKSQEPAVARRGGRKKADIAAPQLDEQPEVPETQMDDMMDVDEAEEQEDQVEDLPTFSRYSAPPSVQRNAFHQAPPSASKRPVSSSSYDNDPSVRRRLGEMTRKYEALELKYKDLRNVAVTEAEKTFDRLKKTSEEKTQGICQANSLDGSFVNEYFCSL